ncbi:sigma-54-dependent Fis family transcriptional regulator [Brevibacillus marinus]|uniref:sigma-54-dependent Fis family transcriptional regulator n=1 Tax=Brevibacillus marinus TaxID=2496837 RepID=UPI000F84D1D9|nr:sigma 54-interacting transcriptional regulator [Brevibacillus marinus]
MGTRTSLLSEISESVSQFIKTMQPIIDFDLSVVDEHLLRIAGTGHYEKYVGLYLPKKSAHDYVISSGEPLILFNPLQHPVCQTCSVRNICMKEVSILYPIRKGKQVIGVITVASFSEENKQKLMAMEQELLSFLQNVADFISSKASENEREKRMATILDTIHEGMILTDHNGYILLVNRFFREKGIEQGDWVQKYLPTYLINQVFREKLPVENVECPVERDGRELALYVTVTYVEQENPLSDILFVFKEQPDFASNEPTGQLPLHFEQIKGRSKVMMETKRLALSAARGSSNVLIQGESGTGKELFARAIHYSSDRAKGPFVAVNCAAIPENLLESELFGYEDGAFTGAKKGGKRGKFELANGGTIFLDEIGDLSLSLQPKLLRVIEYGQLDRIGGGLPIRLDVRIIAATNRDLEAMIAEGTFREDLYYRLNVIHLPIPPLRKRREDIMQLSYAFLQKYNRQFGKNIQHFSEESEKLLLLYNWPGNVRELENAIEYATQMELTNTIQATSLPAKVRNGQSSRLAELATYNLKQIQLATIQNLLDQYGYDVAGKSKAAEQLGISLSTLYRRLREIES